MTERVGFSPARIVAVALNTFTESVRQKVFSILLLVALVFIASALFFRQFNFGEQFKFVKDTCLGLISFFGCLIAIIAPAQMLPSEIENRTIYTLLAKPVRRVEFLLGKYFGSVILLFLSVLLMSVMFGAALVVMERSVTATVMQHGPDEPGETLAQAVQQIQHEARDPNLAQAVLLIFVKTSLLAAIVLLFSTFSTSMIFNIATGFMAWIAGALVPVVKGFAWTAKWILALAAVVPDLGMFNVSDEIVQGIPVSWGHVYSVALYGLVRVLILLVAAQLVFSQREI